MIIFLILEKKSLKLINQIKSKKLFKFHNIFQSYIGYKSYIVIILTIFSGLMESVGIGMLIPLLESISSINSDDINTKNYSFLGSISLNIIDWLKIEKTYSSLLIFICIFFILKALFRFLALALIGILRGKLLFEIKHRLYLYFSNLEYVVYSQKNTGEMVNLLNVQTHRALQAFHFFNQIMMSVINAIIYFSLAMLISSNFGLMIIVCGLFLMLLMSIVNKSILSLSRNNTEESGILAKLFIQTMNGFKYLLATSKLSILSPKIGLSIKRLSKTVSKLSIASAFSGSLREPISIIFIIIIIYIQLEVLNLSLAPILVSLLLFYKCLTSISSVQENYQQTLAHAGAIEAIDDTIKNYKPKVESGFEIKNINSKIEFKNVSYSYPGLNKNIFNKLSINIPTKKIIGIIGDSGAGKTTLVDILAGIVNNYEGEIMFDNVELKDIKKSSLHKLIGYVSQQEFIFDDSIANNITFWSGDWKSDKVVYENINLALKKVNLYDYVINLPLGLDTIIGDRGNLLSGGQKQRLMIAREIYRNPEILIFDEATSALDYNSESLVYDTIHKMKGLATIIIISHNLNLLKGSDLIYVLKNGSITEFGSYENLYTDNQSYLSNMKNK